MSMADWGCEDSRFPSSIFKSRNLAEKEWADIPPPFCENAMPSNRVGLVKQRGGVQGVEFLRYWIQ